MSVRGQDPHPETGAEGMRWFNKRLKKLESLRTSRIGRWTLMDGPDGRPIFVRPGDEPLEAGQEAVTEVLDFTERGSYVTPEEVTEAITGTPGPLEAIALFLQGKWNPLDAMQGWWQQMLDGLGVPDIAGWVLDLLGVKNQAQTAWTNASNALGQIGQFLTSAAADTMTTVGNMVKGTVNNFADILTGFGLGSVANWITDLLGTKSTASTAGTNASNALGQLTSFFTNAGNSLASTVGGWLATARTQAQNAATNFANILSGFGLGAVGDWITDLLGTKSTASTAGTNASNALGQITSFFTNAGNSVAATVGGWLATARTQAQNAATNFANILSGFGLGAVGDWITDLLGTKSTASTAGTNASNALGQLTSFFTNAGNSVAATVGGWLSTARSQAQAAATNFANILSGFGLGAVGDWISDLLGTKSTASTAGTNASNALGQLGQLITNAGQSLASGVGTMLANAANDTRLTLNNVWEGLTGLLTGGTNRTPAEVKTASAAVKSTADTANTNANTANAGLATANTKLAAKIRAADEMVLDPNIDNAAIWAGAMTGVTEVSTDVALVGTQALKLTAGGTTTVPVVYLNADGGTAVTNRGWAVRPGKRHYYAIWVWRPAGASSGTLRIQNRISVTGTTTDTYPAVLSVSAATLPVEQWTLVEGIYTMPETLTVESQARVPIDNSPRIIWDGNPTTGQVLYVGRVSVKDVTDAQNITDRMWEGLTGGTVTSYKSADEAKAAASGVKSVSDTAGTNASNALGQLSQIISNAGQSLASGVGTMLANAANDTRLTLTNIWRGLTGSSSTADRTPDEVRTAAGAVKSTSDTASTNASTANGNIETIRTNAGASSVANIGARISGAFSDIGALIAAAPASTAATVGAAISNVVSRAQNTLNALFRGLTGGGGSTNRTESEVETASSAVKSTGDTALTNAGTADGKATTANNRLAQMVLDAENIASGSDFESATLMPWTVGTGRGRVTDVADTGSASYRFTGAQNPSGAGFTGGVDGSSNIEIRPGERLYAKVRVRRDSAFNATDPRLRLGNNGTISPNHFNVTFKPADFGGVLDEFITREAISSPYPADATRVSISIIMTGLTAGNLWIDNIEIRRVKPESTIPDLPESKIPTLTPQLTTIGGNASSALAQLGQIITNAGQTVATGVGTMLANAANDTRLTLTNIWRGLTGSSSTANRTPDEVRTAAAAVKSTADTADTNASTAGGNIETIRTNAGASSVANIGARISGAFSDIGALISNAPASTAATVGTAITNVVNRAQATLNALWEGLTGGASGSNRTEAQVKTASSAVKSTADTADTNAGTAITNANRADRRAKATYANNLVLDPGFADQALWTLTTGYSFYASSSSTSPPTLLRLDTDGVSRSQWLLGLGSAAEADRGVPVKAGQRYTFETLFHRAGGNGDVGDVGVTVRTYNASVSPRSYTYHRADIFGVQTKFPMGWSTISQDVTIPANHTHAEVYASVGSNVPAGELFYYAAPSFREETTARNLITDIQTGANQIGANVQESINKILGIGQSASDASSDNAAQIAALQASQNGSENNGRSIIVDIGEYANGAVPSTWTKVRDEISGGMVVQNGRFEWSKSGGGSGVELWLYNALNLTSDYEEASAVAPSNGDVDPFSGGNWGFRIVFLRANSAGTHLVFARFAHNSVRIGYYAGGSLVWAKSEVSRNIPAGSILKIRAGTVGGLRIYQALVGNAVVDTWTDSGNATSVGASYRYGGLGLQPGARFDGSQNSPGSFSFFTLSDRAPAAVVGHGLSVYRGTTSSATWPANDSTLAGGFFDTVEAQTDDILWNAATSTATVTQSDWYTIDWNARRSTDLGRGNGAGLLIFVNGAIKRRGQSVRAVDGSTTNSSYYTMGGPLDFGITKTLYLPAGSTIQPGTAASVSASGAMPGSADGSLANMTIVRGKQT